MEKPGPLTCVEEHNPINIKRYPISYHEPGPLTCVEEHNPINIRRYPISYHAAQLQSNAIQLSSIALE